MPLFVRVGGVRLAAVAAGVTWLTLPAGFLAAPGLWALWCLFGGVAQASSFTVIFIMLAGMPGDERRTAARSGLIQSAGYGVTASAAAARVSARRPADAASGAVRRMA